MIDRQSKLPDAPDQHGVHRDTNFPIDSLAHVESMVLTGVPARWSSTLLSESLLLSTIRGEKIGFIGCGRKLGRVQFGKPRNIEFDILQAEQLPIYRIQRAGDERYSNAKVLIPFGDENPIGEIVVHTYTHQSMQFRISYTLYEIQADGMYREPFATVESHHFATEYRFSCKGNTVARMIQANDVRIGLRTTAPNYLLCLEDMPSGMTICVPSKMKSDGRITQTKTIDSRHYQPNNETPPTLSAKQRGIVLATAFLLHCTLSNLNEADDQQQDPRFPRSQRTWPDALGKMFV